MSSSNYYREHGDPATNAKYAKKAKSKGKSPVIKPPTKGKSKPPKKGKKG